MVWSLVEFLFLGILASGVVAVARSATRKRSGGRSAELAESGSIRIPCRVSWKAGTGRKTFVYGKVVADAGGELAFSRRRKDPVPLPRSDWVHREVSWRAGLVNLRYTVPGQDEVRILLSEGDADTLEGLLRGGG